MRLLTRYILKQFFYLFFISIAAFAGTFLIAELFESLRILLNNKVPFHISSQYLLCLIPGILVQTAPVAVLLGVIFCLNQLNRYRELTIMKASGLSIYRIVSPLLVASIIISICIFLVNELVVPVAIPKASHLRLYGIEKRQLPYIYSHISFNEGNRFFYIRTYNALEKSMKEIQIIERRPDKSRTICTRIDAPSGVWKEYKPREVEWKLYNPVIRKFSPSGEMEEMKEMKEKRIFLQYSPDDFKEMKKPEEMSFSAFLHYIKSLKESGNYNINLTVDLYQKLSFPFASFFISIAGIPFALRSKRSGIATGFGMSIVISFVYWIVMSLSLAWGKELLLPPYLAAFLPNIVCLILGIYMLQRTPT